MDTESQGSEGSCLMSHRKSMAEPTFFFFQKNVNIAFCGKDNSHSDLADSKTISTLRKVKGHVFERKK